MATAPKTYRAAYGMAPYGWRPYASQIEQFAEQTAVPGSASIDLVVTPANFIGGQPRTLVAEVAVVEFGIVPVEVEGPPPNSIPPTALIDFAAIAPAYDTPETYGNPVTAGINFVALEPAWIGGLPLRIATGTFFTTDRYQASIIVGPQILGEIAVPQMYENNDGVVWLQNLRDFINPSAGPIDDAEGTATFYDSLDNPVTGATDLPLVSAGSGGYYALVPASAGLVGGQEYTVTVELTNYSYCRESPAPFGIATVVNC